MINVTEMAAGKINELLAEENKPGSALRSIRAGWRLLGLSVWPDDRKTARGWRSGLRIGRRQTAHRPISASTSVVRKSTSSAPSPVAGHDPEPELRSIPFLLSIYSIPFHSIPSGPFPLFIPFHPFPFHSFDVRAIIRKVTASRNFGIFAERHPGVWHL